MTEALLFGGGLILLISGAELLVSGAVRIARSFGVSALLIGLMVGFGTSTPELVTAVRASLVGVPGIGLGNVVGANMANLLLVLGACALVRPIKVDARSLRVDGAMVLISTFVFAVFSALFPLNRWVGVIYVSLLGAYLYRTWLIERRHPSEHTAPFEMGAAVAEVVPVPTQVPEGIRATLLAVSRLIGGVVLVVLGANWLVDAAVAMARAFGVADSVIGLTVVALGTTLPELVTSLAATRRGSTDVALGNVFGSCIYNILGIPGISALVAPSIVPLTIVSIGNPMMLLASVLMLSLAWTGYRISRREGLLLLVLYCGYVAVTWQA
jgi:cation:H+ antiporter